MTPLKANLQLICQVSNEVDTLVLVLTDGEPSDCKMPDIQQMLKARSKSVYMSFLMCTHEDEVVEHYNKCVDPIWGCDITDDYVVVPAGAIWVRSPVSRSSSLTTPRPQRMSRFKG